ncbi:hypothetical protein ARMGADRAFT_1040563 [Armillaria gallica]|uniref:Uncharacterized protein n=1 Tax=Armillaria gallica TaxID=47427 RepID=A0A2H3C9K3_ARMGA|nr:hypothetical protein ARMGADRAFT_1040563 [Armillaria gallica]
MCFVLQVPWPKETMIEGYIKAVEEGLTHNVEPLLEHLAKVNDNAPDPEIKLPDEDSLTFKEYEKQMNQYQEDCKMLKYQVEPKRQALTTFGLFSYIISLALASPNLASHRHLPSEKSSWKDLVTEEHKVAIKEFEEKLHAPILKEHTDVQQYLEQLPSVVKLLLEMIGEVTGCIALIYVAGPQPADAFTMAKLLVPSNRILSRLNAPISRFAAEDEGVALDAIRGDIFNESGGSETLTPAAPATKPFVKAKKPLRVSPVKKPSEVLTDGASGEGAIDKPTTLPHPAPPVKVLMPPLPVSPTVPASSPAQASSTISDKAPMAEEGSSPLSPPVSHAGSATRSILPSPAILRAVSVVRSDVSTTVAKEKRCGKEENNGKDSSCHGKKRSQQESGVSRAGSMAHLDIPPMASKKRGHKEDKGTKKFQTSKSSLVPSSSNQSTIIPTPAMKEYLNLTLPPGAPRWAVTTIKLLQHEKAIKSGINLVKDFKTGFWMWWFQIQLEFCLRDESNMMLLIDKDSKILINTVTADPDSNWLCHIITRPFFIIIKTMVNEGLLDTERDFQRERNYSIPCDGIMTQRVWKNCSREEIKELEIGEEL